MKKHPHKWKIRAGLAVCIAGIYKVQDAVRKVIDACGDTVTQSCTQAQHSLRTAIYVTVAAVIVVIYGYVKRFKKLRASLSK